MLAVCLLGAYVLVPGVRLTMRGLLWLLVAVGLGILLYLNLPELPPGMTPCGCLVIDLA